MSLARIHSAGEWLARLGECRSRTVLTIGNFDGMHRGHQKLLGKVVARARRSNQLAAALTLFPHPARVLRPSGGPSLLMTLDQRLSAFDRFGIDAALVLRFNSILAKLPPEDFVRLYLVETMRAATVLVGENFRFGHRHAGDLRLLERLGGRWGFALEVFRTVAIGGLTVSSSAVRSAVREGRMQDADQMLGRLFSLEGEICTGTGLGRKLIVPTLNLRTEQETLPKNGVYATTTALGGKVYRSVTNIGVRPTFDGARLAIETHLFDFNENCTSGRMEIGFVSRLRDERKFSGPEALLEQVRQDIEQAKTVFR